MPYSGKDGRADTTHEQHQVRQEQEGRLQMLPLCGWDAPLGSKEKFLYPTHSESNPCFSLPRLSSTTCQYLE